MNIAAYKKYMTSEILMGPNSARILSELLEKHPISFTETDIALDLGCGKGLTSFLLAKETGAKVYASDLWIPAKENQRRFSEWGVENEVIPFCEDANELHFEKNLFRALISVDAYHYFGTKNSFFAEKILPLLKDGATVLIGVPGIKDAYAGYEEKLLAEWLGHDAYMFKSPKVWKETIGNAERIRSVETWEMECFDAAWNDWLNTGNEYAVGDQCFFDTHIKPYSCLVGIYIKIK